MNQLSLFFYTYKLGNCYMYSDLIVFLVRGGKKRNMPSYEPYIKISTKAKNFHELKNDLMRNQ